MGQKPYFDQFSLFLPKGNFSKKIRLSKTALITQHLKDQRYKIDCPSNQKLLITNRILKSFNLSVQFIKSFVRYTCFMSHMIYKASPIFDHAHPIIIKGTLGFLEFASKHQKSVYSIDFFLRCSQF